MGKLISCVSDSEYYLSYPALASLTVDNVFEVHGEGSDEELERAGPVSKY